MQFLAQKHVEVVKGLGAGTVEDWAKVLECGDALLTEARGKKKGERSGQLGGGHPLLLDYLGSMEQNGMVARHPSSTERILADPPKCDLNQV